MTYKLNKFIDFKELDREELKEIFLELKTEAKEAFEEGAIQRHVKANQSLEDLKSQVDPYIYQSLLDHWLEKVRTGLPFHMMDGIF